ncbi:MAG: CARDB domain-containing protein [Isosphaeraceae bacterium]
MRNLWDAFEADDTPQAARPIVAGAAPQVHSIHRPTDSDWVKFTLTQPGDAVVETDGPSGDTVVDLYAEADTTRSIAHDDDGGNGSFSRVVKALRPGTYYARIQEYGQNSVIDRYTVSLKVFPPADLSVASARTLPGGPFTPGETVNVSWTVTNAGGGTADPGRNGRPSWTDRVYLSADNRLSPDDRNLGDWSYSGSALAPGAKYDASLSVNLPGGSQWAGKSAYLLIQADRDASVADSNAANNVLAVPIRFASVALRSPQAGRFLDARTPLTVSGLALDTSGPYTVDLAIDNDASPDNGVVNWLARNRPAGASASPLATVNLTGVTPRSQPYYVYGVARRTDTGAVSTTRAFPVTVASVAALNEDALNDAVGGNSYEVFGVDAARNGNTLQVLVRTNFQADKGGSSTGGDIRLVVGGVVYGLAVNPHTTSNGGALVKGDLYRGATFQGGTTVSSVPTFINTYSSRVSGRSSVQVVPTPERPWAYEIRANVDLAAIQDYRPGGTVQAGWAMYCGNDTSVVEIKPDDTPVDVALVSAGFDKNLLKFGYTVTGNPGPVTFRLYQSADATFDPSDTPVDSLAATPGPNSSNTGSFARPAQLAVSSHYLLVVADPDDAITETNENNNIQAIATSIDLQPLVDAYKVVPALATDLNLYHFYGTESLKVPVSIVEQGTDPVAGNVGLTLYLTDRPDLTGTKTELARQTVAVDLKGGEKKDVTVTVTMPDTGLTAGTRYYLVAEIKPVNISEGYSGNPQTSNNVGATAFGFDYVGNPGAFFNAGTYFDVIRKTVSDRTYDPFAFQGVHTLPTDGQHFTAAFENTGGYDKPVLHAYNDTAAPPKPTIGTGLNLEALYPDVKVALAAAVRSYYAGLTAPVKAVYNAHLGNPTNKTDAQIVSSLKTQAINEDTTQVISKEQAIDLFEKTYAHHRDNVVTALAGAVVKPHVFWVLVDIDYNASIGSWTGLLAAVKAKSFDAALAGFQLLNSKRSGLPQIGLARSVANYRYLVGDDASTVGRPVNG